MQKIGVSGQKWLKGLHVFLASLWVGGALALTLLQVFLNPSDGMELYGNLSTMTFIDDFIIIPGGVGLLVTGLIYSIWTNYGWFKYKWVVVKWCINLYGIVFGTFFLGPWINSLPPLALKQGLTAFADPTFTHNRNMLIIFGTFQAATIVFAVFVSTIKPWKKKKS